VALGLIIFDCDGVLVDSEPLAFRILLEGLAEAGYTLEEARAYELLLGRSIANLQSVLRQELGFELSASRLEAMRERLFAAYRQELKAMPGIVQALDSLTLPYCVASSSLPDRIRLSLEVTGLLPRFLPHVFSAAMVAKGKPEPDLFLYAAAAMGVPPASCLVIEDSSAGIEAARRAGMSVLGFLGGSHARHPAYRQGLAALLPPSALFDDMRDLPALIQKLSHRPG
jgi:HAD superfamily hydrolase (TIGR01509 family)